MNLWWHPDMKLAKSTGHEQIAAEGWWLTDATMGEIQDIAGLQQGRLQAAACKKTLSDSFWASIKTAQILKHPWPKSVQIFWHRGAEVCLAPERQEGFLVAPSQRHHSHLRQSLVTLAAARIRLLQHFLIAGL